MFCGQPHTECGASTWVVFSLNASTVFGDNVIGNGQAETGTGFLVCNKRFEDAVQDGWFNADAGVCYFQKDLPALH